MAEYDIEYILPVCKKYHTRLEDFKKYGIMNVERSKVLVTLLAGTDNIPDTHERWANNVDVRVVESRYNQESAKVYDFYANHLPKHLKEKPWYSPWFMKVDDDSFNDVDATVAELNEYDPTKDHYLVTEIRYNVVPGEIEFMIETARHLRWYVPSMPSLFHFPHEVEACVLSYAAIEKILSNQMALSFLELRSHVQMGVTDVALAVSAHMSGILINDVPFMSCHPMVRDFSFFGGKYSHIHFMRRDIREFDEFIMKYRDRLPARKKFL